MSEKRQSQHSLWSCQVDSLQLLRSNLVHNSRVFQSIASAIEHYLSELEMIRWARVLNLRLITLEWPTISAVMYASAPYSALLRRYSQYSCPRPVQYQNCSSGQPVMINREGERKATA